VTMLRSMRSSRLLLRSEVVTGLVTGCRECNEDHSILLSFLIFAGRSDALRSHRHLQSMQLDFGFLSSAFLAVSYHGDDFLLLLNCVPWLMQIHRLS
jgi:hypothetical protein